MLTKGKTNITARNLWAYSLRVSNSLAVSPVLLTPFPDGYTDSKLSCIPAWEILFRRSKYTAEDKELSES